MLFCILHYFVSLQHLPHGWTVPDTDILLIILVEVFLCGAMYSIVDAVTDKFNFVVLFHNGGFGEDLDGSDVACGGGVSLSIWVYEGCEG